MVKEFLTYAVFASILFAAINLHYILFKSSVNQDSLKISKLTTITEPSLNSLPLERRFLVLNSDSSNPIYPDMINIKFSEIK